MKADGEGKVRCGVCPRGCVLTEGTVGVCGARGCVNGEIISLNYGRLTGLAIDPIEKKPLARFMPGSRILSVGSFGCNLFCPFCQNHAISQVGAARTPAEKGGRAAVPVYMRDMDPEQLCALAVKMRGENGNIGIAYTYNEPLVGYEFVRDTARLARGAGLVGVVVTNGCVTDEALDAVLPWTDAMNIDLKAYTKEGYAHLGGDMDTVKRTIARASRVCHVEVTSLIVPGLNENPADMEAEAAWLSEIDPEIVLHITRFFPRFRMEEGAPTELFVMEKLLEAAKRHLRHVLPGNI